MDENKMWAYIEGDLDSIFGYTSIDWASFGFSIPDLRWATAHHYQLPGLNGVTVTMLPIHNLELFYATLGGIFTNENPKYRVMTQAEIDEIHSKLLLEDAEQTIVASKIPSEEDVYRSQILLLLTEIKLQNQNRSDANV